MKEDMHGVKHNASTKKFENHIRTFPQIIFAGGVDKSYKMLLYFSLSLIICRFFAVEGLSLPSHKQLVFQTQHPKGCFFHFGINTFTGQEHGTGDSRQPTSAFAAPTDLDTDQWIEACVAYGGTYAVFTAKHEEGMLNWPSKATAETYNYSIATSPFCAERKKQGRDCDLVAEFLASCDKYNVTRGLYYTFFNSHCKSMPKGTDCNALVRAAFAELVTNYGPIDQFWFDHGDGLFLDLINKYQPGASILGREWTLVGTEGGYVLNGEDTIWYPEFPTYSGTNSSANPWLAYQCDTSLNNNGWFYHPGGKPRFNASSGVDLYGLQCIGWGAGLILNFPPSTRGRIEPEFVSWAKNFSIEWNRRFGPTPRVATANGTAATNLGPNNGVISASLLPGHRDVDYIVMREDLSQGQRVAGWVLEVLQGQPDGRKLWREVGAGSTIGATRIWPLAHSSAYRSGHGVATNVFAVRLRPTISVAPDGLVHIAELSAYYSNSSTSSH